MFKRKVYDQLVTWKMDSAGSSALLVEGARRVGKSTIVEELARNECESYVLIDFSLVSLDKFGAKFGKRVGAEYVLHDRPAKSEGNRRFLLLYMAHLL